MKKKCNLRFKIYFIVIIVLTFLSCAMPVSASLGGYEIQDLYLYITENVQETNEFLNKAFDFSQVSPYDVVNSIDGTSSGAIAVAVRNASKTMALVVATLLLMVDFFRKTVAFEWSSKWENILIFLVKIIVIKQVIQNADVIVGYLYAGFKSINDVATRGNLEFLPCGDILKYDMYVPYRGDTLFDWFASQLWHVDLPYEYNISTEAVKMFYPNATFPAAGSYSLDSYPFPNPVNIPDFVPLIERESLKLYFLAMKAVAIMIFVITIGRIFELAIYTIFAPLPLATFASETTHDVAKSFIKNYIATVLQIAVIVVMFIVYAAVNNYFQTNGYMSTKLIQLVELITLGLGIVKSESWSKKICGAG